MWDKFVSSSKNGQFFHLRGYLSYHEHRFQEHSLVFIRKGKPLAILPATIHGDQVISHGGLTFAGLLLGKNARASDVLFIFDLMRNHYSSIGMKSLLYKVIPNIYHRYPAQEDLYALFRIGANLVRRDLSCCISVSDRIRFSETKRQLVRKAHKSKIQCLEQHDFSEYWTLLSKVVSVHGATPTHSIIEITELHRRFPNQIRLFEARNKGVLMAGTVLFDFGHVVHTQYMANSDEGREIGALDFLIDYLLTHEYQDKEFFSFGISTENNGRLLNEGLNQHKELMGGRAVVYDFYELYL